MVEAAFNKAFEEKRNPTWDGKIQNRFLAVLSASLEAMQNAKKVGNETFLEFFKHPVLFYSSYFFALTCMYLDAK